MAEVKLLNVSKSYNKHQVLQDLSITIKDGECFTFLGPSGCGKTVLLRLIAGFEQPDQGEVIIGDHLVASAAKSVSLPPEARKIGVVFQDYAVWPHKTVYENIIYPLQIQKIAKDQAAQRTMRAIKQVSLNGLENRLPYQLSGGQQQRVALARALVSEPMIMLLDEPLSNLDANLREEMRFEIKELQKNTGVTILYVTHDQEVALAISDRIAIMDQAGKIRQIGSAEEIYEQPVDAFVFKFMGVSNFIPVTQRDGKVYFPGHSSPSDLTPPTNQKTLRDLTLACRPMDIQLTRANSAIQGVIERVALLGAMIDYRVKLGSKEIRVQQDTHEALAEGLLFSEGELCGLKFNNLQYFDSQSIEGEVSP